MTIELHMQIDSATLEGNVLESIVNRDHVSPEEAVLSLLRRMSERNPAQEMIGALSDPESRQMLDEVVSEAYKLRSRDHPRDFGL